MLRNIGLKVVSITLAALLWVVVSGEQVVERVLRIPLEFTNLPSHLELVGEPANVVDVRVRGSSGALSRIAAGELVAVLDLRTARPGPQRLFHLTGTDVRAPFGIEVIQVTPSTIFMAFEPSASKMLPVVPEVDGEPAPGYEVGTVTAEPTMVEVSGPASAVERLTEAITEPVSVDGASATVVESVPLGVADPSVRVRATESARVTATVRPAPVEWALRGVPVTVRDGGGEAGASVSVAPSEVAVYVRGPRAAMSSDASEFDASIDIAGLKPGQYQLPVQVAAPGRVGVVRVEPAQVRVVVR
jgi:YbbR domain-containing protein